MIDHEKLAQATEGNHDAYAAGLDLAAAEGTIRNRVAAIRWELDAIETRLDEGDSTDGLTDALKESDSLLSALGFRREHLKRLGRHGITPSSITA